MALPAPRTVFLLTALWSSAVLAQPADYSLLGLPALTSMRSAHEGRLDTAINIDERHQLRLTSRPVLLNLPAPGLVYDPARATYRYTVMARDNWAWRVGLSTHPSLIGGAAPRGDSSRRFGALPLLHMAGEARIAQRWQMGIDADGMMTARRRALELGLSVQYRLASNLSVQGGWRLFESGGEADEIYGGGSGNAATVGLRLRFD